MSIQTDGIVTGPVDHTFVTDFDTQVHTARLDQLAAPTSNVSMNGHKITNGATPTASTDFATKGYVDGSVTPPGGSSGQVQFNLSSAFAGSPGIVLDSTGVVSQLFHNGINIGGNNSAATALASLSVVIGSAANDNNHDESVCIGDSAQSSGVQAVAIGHGAQAAGSSVAVAPGGGAASGAVCIGNNAGASSGSIVIGSQAFDGGQTHCILLDASGATAQPTAAHQFVAAGVTDGYFGNGVTNAAPSGFALHATGGSTGDVNGANISLNGGAGHGAGVAGTAALVSGAGSITLDHSGLVTITDGTFSSFVGQVNNHLLLSGNGDTGDVVIQTHSQTKAWTFGADGSLACAAGINLAGHLQTNQSASASVAVGTLANKLEIFDGSGTSLGFIPIYATIT